MTRENEGAPQRHVQEGDEMPGFDPASASLGTDAEATGNVNVRPIATPRDDSPASANAASSGSSIQQSETASLTVSNYTTIISVVVIAIAVILAAILIW